MNSVNGKTTLVTGASRGIGLHIATRLARAGSHLVLVARSTSQLEALRHRLIEAHNVRVEVFSLDLSLSDAPEQLETFLTAREIQVDILVNNAALIQEGYIENLPRAQLDASMMVNLRNLFALTQLLLPSMIERREGHIVNMASLAGLGGVAYAELYCATKHAVVGFGRSLRASLHTRGTGVSVSTVCPGYVSDVGMFARLSARTGERAPRTMGTSSPEAVASAVLRSIVSDLPEVVVNPMPVRFFIALQAMFPRISEWLSKVIGVHNLYHRVVCTKPEPDAHTPEGKE